MHSLSHIIKAVMGSAVEVEIRALYHNCKLAGPWHKTLEELGHPKPQTPVQTDNTTAYGLLTNKIVPKALKAMDMRSHWLRDRKRQCMFRYYWRLGPFNKGDYYSKHHPGKHHVITRPEILTPLLYLQRTMNIGKLYKKILQLTARVC